MNLYQQQHQFYCGIDLHANKMYACVVDQAGNKRLHQNFHTRDTNTFLEKLEPFAQQPGSLVVGCESTFNWYWLCDLCEARANSLLAVKLGRAVYFMLRRGDVFNIDRMIG